MSINTKQLRIGNIVQPDERHLAAYGRNPAFVTSITETSFTVCNHYPGKWFEFMPLTVDKLINDFNFKPSFSGKYYEHHNSKFPYIRKSENGFMLIQMGNFEDIESVELKYVHQLQNIFFDLTDGDEI